MRRMSRTCWERSAWSCLLIQIASTHKCVPPWWNSVGDERGQPLVWRHLFFMAIDDDCLEILPLAPDVRESKVFWVVVKGDGDQSQVFGAIGRNLKEANLGGVYIERLVERGCSSDDDK